jgi:hypothetical protein
VKSSCEHGIEPSGSVKCWEVHQWLQNWQLLRKGAVGLSEVNLSIDWKTTFVVLTDTLPNRKFDTRQDAHCEEIIYHRPVRLESPDHAAHYHILGLWTVTSNPALLWKCFCCYFTTLPLITRLHGAVR